MLVVDLRIEASAGPRRSLPALARRQACRAQRTHTTCNGLAATDERCTWAAFGANIDHTIADALTESA